MPRNVEIKAGAASLGSLAQAAEKLGARFVGRLFQTDTYFNVLSGRLKLREFDDRPAELIWYQRSDATRPRVSSYQRVPIDNADSLKQAVSDAWGVLAVVRKRRDVYLWDNVRIHLDEVDSLGTYLELESVLADGQTESDGRRQIEWLCERFKIAGSDFLSYSYVDLLLAESAGQDRPA